MNTYRRGKKKSDIVDKVSQIWNERLSSLINDRYGTIKAFAAAYKDKYGIGNATDAGHWINVGGKKTKDQDIGLPSYDTMRRIADFFGVTVGYLTGETDYHSFEMERACNYLGLNQVAGEAIQRITKLNGMTRFERYQKENYGSALCYLLSADNFEDFLGGICQYAEAAFRQMHPINYMNSPDVQSIKPEVLELALKYREVCYGEEVDDPSEITDEVIDAIDILSKAEGRGYNQQFELEQNVKLAKYDLQEKYFRLIEEILQPENLRQIQAHYYETFASVEELKKRIETSVSK